VCWGRAEGKSIPASFGGCWALMGSGSQCGPASSIASQTPMSCCSAINVFRCTRPDDKMSSIVPAGRGRACGPPREQGPPTDRETSGGCTGVAISLAENVPCVRRCAIDWRPYDSASSRLLWVRGYPRHEGSGERAAVGFRRNPMTDPCVSRGGNEARSRTRR
jgi:hypothetical protein